ncbi:lipolytic protein G-D-S-L family [[Leptolyngbya] sp. PCC 7376]|uniref:lipase n=1 Tax=[Leptolyngbya] sp. PCC 7376 TaxID=111781 RepID=UPI00029EE336|nr:lipase [[Leptolyngbya] sp. PCC 7376]AFY40657.1 lipolytic protein G-D-S-L family [[Leptolyngbya] sp. PCC 7376]
MFKRGRRRSSYSRSRRRKKKISPWTVVAAIPVALIGLEILARLGSSYFEKAEDQLSREAIAHSIKFVDEDQSEYQGLDNRGELLATEAISTGYKLLGAQETEFFSLNEQGFRDNEPLPVAKPQGEIRVFVLGNSAAFGRGVAANDMTVAHRLEQLLKDRVQRQRQDPGSYRPDIFPFFQPSREKLVGLPAKIKQGNYRVVNVSVPGYSSGNELAQFALEILPYQPDLIVLLNGYEDLLLPEDAEATDIPKLDEFAKDPDKYFQQYWRESFGKKIKKSALIRVIANLTSEKSNPQVGEVLSIRERNELSLAEQLPASEEAFAARLERYRENIKQFVALCSSARIPLVVAIQPEITGRPEAKLDAAEKEVIANLPAGYVDGMTTYYPKMVETAKELEKAFPNNLKVLNFYQLNDKFPTPTFIDPIHFNEGAHGEMAQQMYSAIASIEKMQIIPENFYLD